METHLTCPHCNCEFLISLRKRYPAKYTHESALNRDLGAEREALSPMIALATPETDADLLAKGFNFKTGKFECEHRIRELHSDGSSTCHKCKQKFTVDEMKADTKASTGPLPLQDTCPHRFCEQVGINQAKCCQCGGIFETFPLCNRMSQIIVNSEARETVWVTDPKTLMTIVDEPVKLSDSTAVRKLLNHSYTRYCSLCNIQPIHKTNTVGICAGCYATHGEPKGESNDPATTG